MITKEISEAMKQYRAKHKLRQEDLAKIIYGGSDMRDRVCALENVKIGIRSDTIDKLADKLNLIITVTPMITAKEVRMTDAFDDIEESAQHLFTDRGNLEVLTRAMEAFKITNCVSLHLSPHNKAILEELIEKQKPPR